MKKIPFDLNKWLKDKGQKVVTREGYAVTIGIWKMHAPKPIVGCYQYNDEGDEKAGCWYKNGSYSEVNEHPYDLFLVTEKPELSEFEEALAAVVHSWGEPDVSPYNAPEVLKEDAANLLAIARKQIEVECIADDSKTLDEDERIRKELIAFLRYYYYGQGDSRPFNEDWISWLEKWKKQKSTNSYKPTYEQMEALRFAVNHLAKEYVSQSVRLSIMYDHLKEED